MADKATHDHLLEKHHDDVNKGIDHRENSTSSVTVDSEYDMETPLLGKVDTETIFPAAAAAATTNICSVTFQQKRKRKFFQIMVAALLGITLLIFGIWSFLRHTIDEQIIGQQLVIHRLRLTSPQDDSVTLAMNFTLQKPNRSQNLPSILVALLSSPFFVAYGNFTIGRLEFPTMFLNPALPEQSFQLQGNILHIMNKTSWNDFSKEIIFHRRLKWHLFTDQLGIRLFGLFYFKNFSFSKIIVLNGMDQLQHLRITSLNLLESKNSSLLFTMDSCLYNPSKIEIIPIGNMCMHTYFEGIRVGSIYGRQVKLDVISVDESTEHCRQSEMTHGYNALSFEGKLDSTQQNLPYLSRFFTNYLTGQNTTLVATACVENATSVPLYVPAMQNLSITTAVPPLSFFYPETPYLVKSSTMYLFKKSIFDFSKIPTSLELLNPLNVAYEILSMDFNIYPCKNWSVKSTKCFEYYTAPLARMNHTDSTIMVPRRTLRCYPCCIGNDCLILKQGNLLCPQARIGSCYEAEITSFFSLEAISTFIHSILSSNGLLARIRGKLTIRLSGSFRLSFDYSQDDLVVRNRIEDGTIVAALT